MDKHNRRHNECNARRAQGFTLIELLIAISILGLIAVLGWRSLDSIVRTRQTLSNEIEQARGLHLTFGQLQSDCEHIAATAVLGGRANILADQAGLYLVRSVNLDNQPQRYQVVAYRIKDDVLTRRESPPVRDLLALDAAWQAMQADTDANPAVTLQTGITQMVVQTWYNDNPGWRVASGDALKALAPGVPAPSAIGLEMALQLRGKSAAMNKAFLLGGL